MWKVFTLVCITLIGLGGLGTWYQGDYCSSLEKPDEKPNPDLAKDGEKKAKETDSQPAQKPLISSGTRSTINIYSPLINQGTPYAETNRPKRNWSESFVCEAKITDVSIAWFTLLLVMVTGGLICAGISQERHLRDTARKELRAYVAVDAIYFPWNPQPRGDMSDRSDVIAGVQPKIRIKNFGKTTAYSVALRSNGKHIKGTRKFPKEYVDSKYTPPKPMLSPDQPYATRLYPGFKFNPKTTPTPEGMETFVYGAVIYQDIYQRWWMTRFCYIYDTDPQSPNRFVPHSEYNEEQEYESEKIAHDSLAPYI